MADTSAVKFIESLYSHIDQRIRDIVGLLPDTSIAAQDDGSVVSNQRRILNFQGEGVAVTEDPARRRVNVFVPGSPATGASSSVISTAGLEKRYTLTSGDISGAPANWYTVGFNDTAWSNSVAMTSDVTAFYALVPGTTWVSDVAGNVTTPAGCLIRRTFTLAAGSITSATLQINVDDRFGPNLDAAAPSQVYLNGVNISSRLARVTGSPTQYVTIALSPSELNPGGTNVLAAHVYNPAGGSGPHALSYKFTIGTSTSGADARYQLMSEKGVANGYAGLDTDGEVPTAQLGSGSASATTYLRGDQSWATPAGGGGSSDMELISAQLLSGAAATVTFSSIPGTYRHLMLEWQARSSQSATAVQVFLQFNGDTGANYDLSELTAFGTSPSSAGSVAQTRGVLGQCSAATAPNAGMSGSGQVFFPNYAGTVFWKQARARNHLQTGTTTTTQGQLFDVIAWRNTGAITSIVVYPAAGSFITGSLFCLYGVT